MDTHHLWWLATEDWGLECRRDTFCFHCSSFFCNHCCLWHWEYHHPEIDRIHLPRFATFGLIDGYPAVLYEFPLTFLAGSIWQDIERFRLPHPHSHDGANWILLKPMLTLPSDPITGQSCLNCHRRIWMAGALYCCANCKLAQVHQGEGRDLMLAFVQADYDQALPRDRFCCLCFKSFSSAFCAQHTTLHHPYNVAGYPGQIVEIVHINGWAAVAPSMLVPGHVLAGVQALNAGGAILYPLAKTAAAAASLYCSSDRRFCHNCREDIPNNALYCSLRCKVFVVLRQNRS